MNPQYRWKVTGKQQGMAHDISLSGVGHTFPSTRACSAFRGKPAKSEIGILISLEHSQYANLDIDFHKAVIFWTVAERKPPFVLLHDLEFNDQCDMERGVRNLFLFFM